jgi:hypothetical protein
MEAAGVELRATGLLRHVSRRSWLLDLAAFTGTVVLAVTMRWEARDLVWALWTSSLIVGYATIVTAIVRGARELWESIHVLAVLGGLGLLAFFTFHFGMFHFVHSVFLNMFFPLHGDPQGFPNFARTVGVALASYWPVVIASLISRYDDLGTAEAAGSAKDGLSSPYKNVVRMHILIFVFAGLHAAGLSRYAIYPVLAAYFFPWGALRRR